MALAAVVAMLAAGCARSDDSSAPAAAGTAAVDKASVKCGAGTGQAATGAPIKVRAIVTASQGIDWTSSPVAAKAYFDCVNANGGISGRPISYEWRDDGLDPQRASQFATQFAADSEVVAIVGGASFAGCAVTSPIWQQAGLYELAASGAPQPCFSSPNIASTNAGPRVSSVAAAQYAVDVLGAKKLSTIGSTIPGLGDWMRDGVRDYAATRNVQVVTEVIHEPGVKDPNSVLLQALKGDPDAVILFDPAVDNAAILKAAQAQGLEKKTRFVCVTTCYDATFPAEVGAAWNGFVSNSEFTTLEATTPDNQLWQKVLDAYAPKGATRDSFSQAGFLAAKFFTDALLKVSGPIDRASANKAIVGIEDYRSDMLCSPWYYGTAPAHNPNHVTRYVKIENGKYVEAKGCTPTDDPDLAPILAAERAG